MTDVAFHFGAPDKLEYACRLLRKAVGSGAQVTVVADETDLQQLDADLWAISPTDFLPHCLSGADVFMQKKCPVVLASDIGGVVVQKQVLVNLAPAVVSGFEKFSRVIEVVSTDEQDRDLARQRWMHYKALGYTMTRHDLRGAA